jgi:hypothetical protein
MAEPTEGWAWRLPDQERTALPLTDRFQRSLAKSKGALSLHDHTMDSTKVAVHVLNQLPVDSYPVEKRDTLVLATYLHDLGKLDQDFQKMLYYRSVGDEESVRGLHRVKHEASSLDAEFRQLVERDLGDAIAAVADVTEYQAQEERVNLEDLFAFAVSHHGLFYVSVEKWPGRPETMLTRRQWTTFYPRERRRITLTDLLLRYHPLGGLVIVSDLVASYCYGENIPLAAVLGEHETVGDFVSDVLMPNVDALDTHVRAESGRDYGLRDILSLLLGGLRHDN